VNAVVTCPVCGKRNRVPASASGFPRCGNCRSPLPWLVEADDSDFAEVVEHSSIPVLVDFWATWCGPCRIVAPTVERIAQELAGRIKAVKVDADRAPKVSARFGVQSIPTLLVMDEGREVERTIGALPADQLMERIHKSLNLIASGE
jgi:thioredoxin 2